MDWVGIAWEVAEKSGGFTFWKKVIVKLTYPSL